MGKELLACPVCGAKMFENGNNLFCSNFHCQVGYLPVPKQYIKKGLTMTREELVKELNKIKGIEARIDGDVLRISGEDICDLQYEYGDLVVCGQIILAENRTPEQVLSVVKALVG